MILNTLNASAAITSATVPSMGYINRYNASSGPLSVTLPSLSSQAVGGYCVVEKDSLDTTYNWVTFTCAGADTFADGSTSVNLVTPGELRDLHVVSIGGTKYWKAIDGHKPRGTGLFSNPAQYSLSNSAVASTIIGVPGVPSFYPGATYRIEVSGTVQFASTSGTLTFTPLVMNTALAQTCSMPSQGSSGGPVNFDLRYLVTIRSTGVSGTAIAKPFGRIETATQINLSSTSSSVTTVNTTTTSLPSIGLQAQWQTASASNILLVEIATIERVI